MRLINMETNNEIKLSEKLYRETLDELVTKVWKYKYDRDTPIPSWDKFIEYVGEGGSNKDIEKAVKLAIDKTYDAFQNGQLTEVGQTLFDRRKDIESYSAKRVFAELETFRHHRKLKDGTKYSAFLDDEYEAVKKKHGVD